MTYNGVRAYTYEASVHCPACALQRFTRAQLDSPDTEDQEGNPIGAIFDWDECLEFDNETQTEVNTGRLFCDDCLQEIE